MDIGAIIPVDLWHFCIFKHLGPRDLSNIRATSTSLRRVVESFTGESIVGLEICTNDQLNYVAKYLPEAKLDISEDTDSGPEDKTCVMLENIEEIAKFKFIKLDMVSCEDLTELNISNINIKGGNLFIKKSNRITMLDNTNSDLHTLTLESCIHVHTVINFRNLSELTIDDCWELNEVSSLPNLTSLSIINSRFDSTNQIKLFNLPKLQELYLSNVIVEEIKDIPTLINLSIIHTNKSIPISGCPNIETLDIRHNNMNYPNLVLPHLTDLIISGTFLDISSLLYGANLSIVRFNGKKSTRSISFVNLPKLTRLSINDATIDTISNNPQLSYLGVYQSSVQYIIDLPQLADINIDICNALYITNLPRLCNLFIEGSTVKYIAINSAPDNTIHSLVMYKNTIEYVHFSKPTHVRIVKYEENIGGYYNLSNLIVSHASIQDNLNKQVINAPYVTNRVHSRFDLLYSNMSINVHLYWQIVRYNIKQYLYI